MISGFEHFKLLIISAFLSAIITLFFQLEFLFFVFIIAIIYFLIYILKILSIKSDLKSEAYKQKMFDKYYDEININKKQ